MKWLHASEWAFAVAVAAAVSAPTQETPHSEGVNDPLHTVAKYALARTSEAMRQSGLAIRKI